MIEAHEYVRRENHKDFFFVQIEVLVPTVSAWFTHIDAETASSTIESDRIRLLRHGNLLLSHRIDLDDVYSGHLKDEVDCDACGVTKSGCCRRLRSKFDRYRHILIERDKQEVSSFLSGLLY